MDMMDTIILEDNPFMDEQPEGVQAFNLDGTPNKELTAQLQK